MIWLHSPQKPESFLETSRGKTSYLDVMVSLKGGKLSTNEYHKPTDAHQYLNFRSCRPPHVKKGIPYSQAFRLKRICDLEDKFEKRFVDLKGIFG